VPEKERDAKVKAFVKAYRYKGPVFAVAAISGMGTRALVYAIQEWLDAHPATAVETPVDDAAEVVTPAPIATRRRRATR
jgi:GTP-binding protein